MARRDGWPDLQAPATPFPSFSTKQVGVRPGFEQSGENNRRDPDADIVPRAVIDYARGASGELQPDPLAGLDDLFAPGSKP